jgi:hypothetical protein
MSDADATTEKEGRYLVTHADADSAVLKDVDGGQVHTLAENPGVEANDVIEGTLAADPPMEVVWRVVEVGTRRSLSVDESEEPPTAQERELAADQPVGDLTRRERAGEGEIHVLTVPGEEVEAAVSDVLSDEATLVRAARLEVNRVEVRSEVRPASGGDGREGGEEDTTRGGTGVVSVRYLP